jgi:two-component system chemotaxis response regulator CheY
VPATLDEQAVARNFFSLPFRFGGCGGDLVVRQEAADFDPDDAEGKCDQRVEHLPAAPALAQIAAALPVFLAEMFGNGILECVQGPPAACLPIFALEQHDEVVAAYTADEIAIRIAAGQQDVVWRWGASAGSASSADLNGMDVATAVDGRNGLEKIKADAGIRLVVSDVNMPNMDGLTTVEKIRGDLGNRTVNVVMLTTESSPAMKERGKAAGVKGWIVKPFKGDLVLDTFKRLAS